MSIVALCAGDPDAWRALLDRHSPVLRQIARERLGAGLRGKVSESDVIQSAYAAVTEGLATFEDRGPGSFGRWLRGIAANKALDQVRRYRGTEKRSVGREARDDAGDALRLTASEESPSQAAARADEDAAVLRLDLTARASAAARRR